MNHTLTGQRALFNRLEERQTARRDRVNQVRQLGGLEPVDHRSWAERYPYTRQYDLYRELMNQYWHVPETTVQKDLELRPINLSGHYAVGTGRTTMAYAPIWHGMEDELLKEDISCNLGSLEIDFESSLTRHFARLFMSDKERKLEEMKEIGASNNDDFTFLLNKEEF